MLKTAPTTEQDFWKAIKFGVFAAFLLSAGFALFDYENWAEKTNGQTACEQESPNANQAVSGSTSVKPCAASPEQSAAGQRGNANAPSFWDIRITDVALGLFTYCLIVVSWFQIRTSENAVRAIERPWLFIQGVRTSSFLAPQEGHPARFHIAFQNPGRTQSRITKFRDKIFTAREVTEAVVDSVEMTEAPLDVAFGVTIPAAGKEVETVVKIESVSRELAEQVNVDMVRLISRGVLTYEGAFGDRYETAFCVAYVSGTKEWEGFGGAKYNYSI